MSFTSSRELRCIAVCGVLTLLGLPAMAQFRAGVEGSITDPSGASVPNAKITLLNQETKRQQTTQSSAEGFYRFDGLAPGLYMVNVELNGFKHETRSNINVPAEQIQGVNVTLSPGEESQSVTVLAEGGSGLQTENANVGGTITNKQIQRLPQIGRDGSGNSVGLPNTTGPGGMSGRVVELLARFSF